MAAPRVNAYWLGARERLEDLCDEVQARAPELLDGAGGVLEALLEAWAHLYPEAHRIGEKTPAHLYYLDDILTRFRGAQALIIHRDPRAVALSEKTKLEKLGHPDRSFGPLKLAIRWISSYDLGQRLARRYGPRRVMNLRFEDLVLHPEDTIRAVCDFLDEPFEPAMLDVGVVNSSFQSARSGQQFDASSLTRWKERLPADTGHRLEYLVQSRMIQLGYTHHFLKRTPPKSAFRDKWLAEAAALVARFQPALFYSMLSNTRRVAARA